MRQQLVTIAIIVHSESQDFLQTMRSAMWQDYEALEILICASKLSGKITLSLNKLMKEDKRIRVIYPGNGTKAQLKREAVKQAKGDYILFLNGDDWIDCDYLTVLMHRGEQISNDCEADIIQSGQMLVAEDKFLRTSFYEYDRCIEKPEILPELLDNPYIGNEIWNKLIRVSLLRRIAIDEKDNETDIRLLYRLLEQADKLLVLSDYKYYVRVQEKITVLRRLQMKRDSETDSFAKRVERAEAYAQRYEELSPKYATLSKKLLSSFLKQAIQVTVMYPGNAGERKAYEANLKQLAKSICRKEIKAEGNALLSRKEQLVLQHFLIGTCCYRIVRWMEEKHPDSYARINHFIDRKMEKRQEKQTPARKKKAPKTAGKIYLLGMPEYHNLGDHAIAYAEEQFARTFFPEKEICMVSENTILHAFQELSEKINSKDILLLQGGGNMGSEYPEQENIRTKIITAFPHNHIVVMPQTIFFGKGKESQKILHRMVQNYSQHKHLTLVAREEVSYAIMKQRFKKNRILLCPDMVLSLPYEKVAPTVLREDTRKGALLVLRSDAEGIFGLEQLMEIKRICHEYFATIRMTETSISYAVSAEEREQELKKKWKEFLQAEVVVTDRLHGMIFAAITKTPCVVLTNYNHKLSGSFQWLEPLGYIRYCNQVEALREILEMMKRNEKTIDRNMMPQYLLQDYYEKLAKAVNEEKADV